MESLIQTVSLISPVRVVPDWTAISTLAVSTLAAIGTIGISIGLLVAYRRTNDLSARFQEWTMQQANPRLTPGQFQLTRVPSEPGFKVAVRLYNPGSSEITLLKCLVEFDRSPELAEEKSFESLRDEFKIIHGHRYLSPDGILVHTLRAKDPSYWPERVNVWFDYLAGGEPHRWVASFRTGQAQDKNVMYLEELESTDITNARSAPA